MASDQDIEASNGDRIIDSDSRTRVHRTREHYRSLAAKKTADETLEADAHRQEVKFDYIQALWENMPALESLGAIFDDDEMNEDLREWREIPAGGGCGRRSLSAVGIW